MKTKILGSIVTLPLVAAGVLSSTSSVNAATFEFQLGTSAFFDVVPPGTFGPIDFVPQGDGDGEAIVLPGTDFDFFSVTSGEVGSVLDITEPVAPIAPGVSLPGFLNFRDLTYTLNSLVVTPLSPTTVQAAITGDFFLNGTFLSSGVGQFSIDIIGDQPQSISGSITTVAVPESSNTAGLLALGVTGAAIAVRKRMRSKLTFS